MVQRYNKIGHELCLKAVLKFLDGKWFRPDVQREIACYAGIGQSELARDCKAGAVNVKMEIAEAFALQLENILDDLDRYGPEALDEYLDPVQVRPRKDGMTGKIREIALLPVWHQILGHLAVLALEPLLAARITPWQHASLPGRGDSRLKAQVERCLRSNLGIRYAVKRDVRQAYGSLQYSAVIAKIREEIPSAQLLLALLEGLGTRAPGGHLIIGGYLDSWLFNLAMAYAVHHAMSLTKTRRGRTVRLVIRPQIYMDDVCLMGSRLADLRSAFSSMGRYLLDTFQLEWKSGESVTKFLSVMEEHARKKAPASGGRGCPALDMGGWLFHRTYTTMRPRVYRVARRTVLRCQKDLKQSGRINWQRAQRMTSYYGRICRCDSAGIQRQYGIETVRAISAYTVSWYNRKRRTAAC